MNSGCRDCRRRRPELAARRTAKTFCAHHENALEVSVRFSFPTPTFEYRREGGGAARPGGAVTVSTLVTRIWPVAFSVCIWDTSGRCSCKCGRQHRKAVLALDVVGSEYWISHKFDDAARLQSARSFY
uniref:Uncharacterized protein n=1 Tax=Oryza glaberrima TaxID=4538 RepID=A0A679B9Z3_ORYGL|nr:hypothetical protein [Oryza glaberrima]